MRCTAAMPSDNIPQVALRGRRAAYYNYNMVKCNPVVVVVFSIFLLIFVIRFVVCAEFMAHSEICVHQAGIGELLKQVLNLCLHSFRFANFSFSSAPFGMRVFC